MKTIQRITRSILVWSLFFSGMVFAQNEVPNSSFEFWSNGLNPDSWNTFNSPLDTNVTPSDDAYMGFTSARMEVNNPTGLPPMLQAHNGSGAPFAVSQNYDVLVGYYKYFPQGSDTVFIHVTLHGDDPQNLALSEGDLSITAPASDWTRFEVPIITYFPGTMVQGAIFFHLTAIPAPHAGSYFLVDELSLEMSSTAIEPGDGEIPADFALSQNYPNPFNPATVISYQLSVVSDVELNVYDLQGRKVRTLVAQRQAAGSYQVEFNAEGLSSGVYFYRIQAGSFSAVRKMLLTR